MKDKFTPVFLFSLAFYFLIAVKLANGQTKTLMNDLRQPSGLSEFIDSIINEEMVKEHLPAVAFALVYKDQVVLKKAYGLSNVEQNTHADADQTIFRIGSISKVFTSIALSQLADKGLISLEDEVNKFLTEDLKLKNKYPEPVKIWHLLTHTAGFDQKLRGRIFENKDSRPNIGEFLKGELIRIRPPGQVSCYDTYGITLAGRIIENVSGLSFNEYMDKNIFTPLGMNSTSVEVKDELKDNLAIGYGLEGEALIPQKYELYTSTPASSIDASTVDMTKFMRAILGDGSFNKGRILSKKMANQIKDPQFRNHPDYPGFAYGFWEDLSFSQRAIWHGGIMNGYTSSMYLYPEHNLGLYLVYTRDFETGPDPRLRNILSKELKKRWFLNNKKEAAKKVENTLQIDTERFSGTYANILYCHTCFEGEGASRQIHSMESVRNGVLRFMGMEFFAASSLEFVDKSGIYKIAFRENSNGDITHVFGNFGSDAVYEKLGEALLKTVLASSYESKEASPLKAMTYRGMHDWPNAITEYKKITEQRPSDGRAFHYLGFCLKNAGRDEEAINAFTKSYDLNLWTGYNASYIAEIYVQNKDFENAFDWIGKMIEIGKEMGESTDDIKRFIFGNPVLKKLENEKQVLEMLKN